LVVYIIYINDARSNKHQKHRRVYFTGDAIHTGTITDLLRAQFITEIRDPKADNKMPGFYWPMTG